MGFNILTLLSLPFGLLLPAVVIVCLIIFGRKNKIAYGAIGHGFAGFLASIIAAFILFFGANALFLSSFKFEDDTSGLGIAGTVIVILIAAIYVVNESFKMMSIKKYNGIDEQRECAGIAYSVGVMLAQNVLAFVALNIFNNYKMDASFALFTGIMLFVTGIIYTALAAADDIMLKEGHKGPAYAISAVYYLFWISLVLCYSSRILLFIVTAFIFVVAMVLSGVFIVRYKKSEGGKK